MRTRDVARNRKPEPGPAFVLVACIVKSKERFEYLLAQICRNTWAVIIYCYRQITMITVAGNRNRARVACCVRDQIGKATFKRCRAHGNDRRAVKYDA